jgi:prevent-host-death family protein
MTIDAFEAKTHFSQILEEVQTGKDYTVTRRESPLPRSSR